MATNKLDDNVDTDMFRNACNEEDCTDEWCQELHNRVLILERSFNSLTSETDDDKARCLFQAIYEHCRMPCDETNCPVPFCLYISHVKMLTEDDPNSIMSWIKNEYFHATLGQFFRILKHSRFIFMDSSIQWPSGNVLPEPAPLLHKVNKRAFEGLKERLDLDVEHFPVNEDILLVDDTKTRYVPRLDLDFTMVYGYLSKGVYRSVACSRTISSPFFIKMEQSFFLSRRDYIEEYLKSIKKMSDCSHENISRLLWISVSPDMRILSSYLHHCCDMEMAPNRIKELNNADVCRLIRGLVRGTEFLHITHGLYFLNWQVKALLCDLKKMNAKLHDFTNIFPVGGGGDEDLQQIIDCLECSSIPPELLCDRVGAFTEVYGIASVMLHVASGRTLMYDSRHLTREEKIKKLVSLWCPSSTDFFKLLMESHFRDSQPFVRRKPLRELLEGLLVPYTERMNLEELEKRLTHIINEKEDEIALT